MTHDWVHNVGVAVEQLEAHLEVGYTASVVHISNQYTWAVAVAVVECMVLAAVSVANFPIDNYMMMVSQL